MGQNQDHPRSQRRLLPQSSTAWLVITASILAEGTQFVDKCLQTVRSFDAFDDANDPWGEHDFGGFEVEGKRCFFKTRR
jgi:hypothetical protein